MSVRTDTLQVIAAKVIPEDQRVVFDRFLSNGKEADEERVLRKWIDRAARCGELFERDTSAYIHALDNLVDA